MTRPVFALLSEAEFRALRAQAQRRRITANDLVALVIRGWAANHTECACDQRSDCEEE